MKYTHLLVLALFCGALIPSSKAIQFSSTVNRYTKKEINRKQLIEAYDALHEDAKESADRDLEGIKSTIKQLRNAEEYKDTFKTLVELYAKHEIKRQDLINAYERIENEDDRQLADQALNIRLKKTLQQLKQDALNKVPETPFRPAFRVQPSQKSSQAKETKPRTTPVIKTASATRAVRPAFEIRRSQTTPQVTAVTPKSDTRDVVQLRIAYGRARSMHDLRSPLPKSLPQYRVPPIIKQPKTTVADSKVAQSRPHSTPKSVAQNIIDQEQELVSRQAQRLGDEESDVNLRSPRSQRDWRARAAQMKQRYEEETGTTSSQPRRAFSEEAPDIAQAESHSPLVSQAQRDPDSPRLLTRKRTAQEQRKIDDLQNQVAQSLRQQDQQKTATTQQAREADTGPHAPIATQAASSSARQEATPIRNAQQKAEEMRRRLASLNSEKNYSIIDGIPYIKVDTNRYRPSQPEFTAHLAKTIDVQEALQMGEALASAHKTDASRWKFLHELMGAYTKPQAPKVHVRALMTATIRDVQDKTVEAYTNLPQELKLED